LRRNEAPQSSDGLFEHASPANNREQLFRRAGPAAGPETSSAAASENDRIKTEFSLRHMFYTSTTRETAVRSKPRLSSWRPSSFASGTVMRKSEVGSAGWSVAIARDAGKNQAWPGR